jgi:hypothetical protein
VSKPRAELRKSSPRLITMAAEERKRTKAA